MQKAEVPTRAVPKRAAAAKKTYPVEDEDGEDYVEEEKPKKRGQFRFGRFARLGDSQRVFQAAKLRKQRTLPSRRLLERHRRAVRSKPFRSLFY
jgi:hypothetical protein